MYENEKITYCNSTKNVHTLCNNKKLVSITYFFFKFNYNLILAGNFKKNLNVEISIRILIFRGTLIKTE